MRNCRVVFSGEFQKFSDMVTPSFLLKTPERPKKRKRSKSCSACGDNCKDPCLNMDACAESCENPCQDGVNGCKNPEDCAQDDLARTGAYGTGFGFQPGQPTIIPCYGTYGPTGNPMIFGIPPPTQYGGFGVPGPIVLPVAPPSSVGQGDPRSIPAAGLPTQYTNKFNPCTGEVYQCGDRQMPPGRPQGTAQVPSYNQFIQGLGMSCAPNSQYIPFDATFQQHPINQMPVTPPSGGSAPAYGRNNQPMNCEPNNQNYSYTVPQSTNQVHVGANRSEVYNQQSQATHSRPVPQLESSKGQLPHGNNRSKSPNQRSPSRGDRSGRAYANNNCPENVHASPGAQRSKSLSHRNESREGRSGKPQASRATTNYHSNSGGDRNVDHRSAPKSMASAGEVRSRDNNRSYDSRNRNKSVGAPTNRQPVLYDQQRVGMGIDPSNQYYPYNECAPLNATFVQDHNPFYAQPGHDVNRTQAASAPNLSKAGPKKDKNSNKVPSSFKPSKEKSTKCCCTRFDPNNQYYPHYVSEESDCPPEENVNSGKKKTQEKNCLELLSR